MSYDLRKRANGDGTKVAPDLKAVSESNKGSVEKPAIATESKVDIDDIHSSYEFGGPVGTMAMMIFFPFLMWYMWACLVFFDGKLMGPSELSVDGFEAFGKTFGSLVYEHAFPTPWATTIYLGLMVFQLLLAIVMPGYKQEGLPISSLGGKRLMYNCNALMSFYTTCVTAAALHFSGTFRLTEFIDHFGSMMTVAMIVGFVTAAVCYVIGVSSGKAIRMSGNPIYDYFMGSILNPRVGPVDIKMWAEVRIPWVLLFLIALGGAAKQYEKYGYVTPNQAFMVLATGLYINACAKGEECIPQTWDMAYEKFGWLLAFWNFAGVPFSYANSIIYMATHDPSYYRFPTWAYFLLYGTLLTAYFIFDTSMSQKSRFKMQQAGNFRPRWTFPQLPYGTLKDPKFIQTSRGSKLLIDGWWAWARKPNYTSDYCQAFTWGLCAGFGSPLPYFYPAFFLTVLIHRCGRDFERCARKYGKDWEEYCRVVPYKFIPYVY